MTISQPGLANRSSCDNDEPHSPPAALIPSVVAGSVPPGDIVAIDRLRQEGLRLGEKPLASLRQDFELLDFNTRPSSGVQVLSEYGIRCSTDANSEASRRWRSDFLREILTGTYRATPPDTTIRRKWFQIRMDVADPGMCRPEYRTDCTACEQAIGEGETPTLAWPADSPVFQMCNAQWIHPACIASGADRWVLLGPEKTEGE
jgi:hypothetical protein